MDGLSAGVAASVPVPGHVRYVVPGGDPGEAASFLVDALIDPVNLLVLFAGGLALAVGVRGYLRARPARADLRTLRAALEGYRDLLPWLVRLSVGLPLVGAGFIGIGDALAADALVRLAGVGLGFLLLFGLATRAVAAVGLLTYLAALAAFGPALLFAFEYVPGFLAAILLGGGRPSADHVLARLADDDRTVYSRIDPVYRELAVPFERRIVPYRAYVPTVVRAGLGATFVFLGVAEKLLAPAYALAAVEKYDLTAVVPVSPELWVLGAGLGEVLVGTLLIAGLLTRAFAAVALGLFTLTLFGLPDDPVLAHVSLFGLASLLIVTGAGPLSLDWRLAETDSAADREREPSPAD
ncbi:DoxX family protein [Halobacteriales archaeon QS_5_70_17]|nr:MAG: DoxX family protein [Halobacteriales archaeon QS_5_70_17]